MKSALLATAEQFRRDEEILHVAEIIDELWKKEFGRVLTRHLEEIVDSALMQTVNHNNGMWHAGYAACARDLTKLPTMIRDRAEQIVAQRRLEQEAAQEPKTSDADEYDTLTRLRESPQLTL